MFKHLRAVCAAGIFLAIGTGAAFAHITLETQEAAVGAEERDVRTGDADRVHVRR